MRKLTSFPLETIIVHFEMLVNMNVEFKKSVAKRAR